jgi:hypothetical protein
VSPIGAGTVIAPNGRGYDLFDQRIRDYILGTLSPLVNTSDSTGRLLLGLLRKFLKMADHDALQSVISQTVEFVEGMKAEGLLIDPEALVDESAEYLASIPGQSAIDWSNTVGEIDPSEIASLELPLGYDDASDDEPSMDAPEDIGSGYQATVEGDEDTNGEEHAESLSENGPG